MRGLGLGLGLWVARVVMLLLCETRSLAFLSHSLCVCGFDGAAFRRPVGRCLGDFGPAPRVPLLWRTDPQNGLHWAGQPVLARKARLLSKVVQMGK